MCVCGFLHGGDLAGAGSGSASDLHGLGAVSWESSDAEDAARWLACFDPLTRLPNRALFDQRVAEEVAQARDDGASAVVLALDLDRFQLVNESLGYEAGNTLLRLVAQRMEDVMAPGELVARSCADEYMALASASSVGELESVVERYRSVFRAPFRLDGEALYVDATFGVGRYPRDAEGARSLVHAALTALHQARRRQTAVSFYEPSMHVEATERMTLARDLRFALDRDELELAYQPQIDLETGGTVGVEALARWRHPQRGAISPSVFIPLAEQTGSIEQLTDRVLWRACHDIAELRRTHRGLRLSVNLSARELVAGALAHRVRRCLDASSLDPSVLDVEITESILMRDVEESSSALEALRGCGVQLSVDDFGTGYSSLSYLRRFDLDILKIDRSFVESIDAHDGDGGAIAELIVGLGRTFGARTIAEGVETRAQADALRTLGCHEAQGYLFSKPVSRRRLESLLAA